MSLNLLKSYVFFYVTVCHKFYIKTFPYYFVDTRTAFSFNLCKVPQGMKLKIEHFAKSDFQTFIYFFFLVLENVNALKCYELKKVRFQIGSAF